MHPAQILSAVILVASSGSSTFGLGSSFAFAADLAPIEKFEHRLSDLETKLAAEKKIERRYDLFLAAHQDLLKIRKENTNSVDALSMSLFLDALADFPAKKDFRATKCPSYLKKAKTMMSSRAPEEGEDPMVARAFKVAGEICK